jgi:hypothetical protein
LAAALVLTFLLGLLEAVVTRANVVTAAEGALLATHALFNMVTIGLLFLGRFLSRRRVGGTVVGGDVLVGGGHFF